MVGPAIAEEAVKPANQLEVSGNACGPTALLNSFKLGSKSWQNAYQVLPGVTDREKIIYWIRRYGKQPSTSLKGHNRWTRAGINTDDLLMGANEQAKANFLPQLSLQSLVDTSEVGWFHTLRHLTEPKGVLESKSQQVLLLKRARKSLDKGFPPILSIRRYVLEKGQWQPQVGHFVTITSVEDNRNNESLRLHFIDPWGGRIGMAEVKITDAALLQQGSGLAAGIAVTSDTLDMGKSKLAEKQPSVVIAGNLIGQW